MDLIDSFVLPPTSKEHILLFKYVLIFIFTVHFSYMGMIMGNSFYSVIFNILAKKKNNQIYSLFAGDLMGFVLMDKPFIVMFGILPSICIWFIYDEILYKSHIMTTVFLLYSVILTIAGFILLSIYKNTFSVREKNFFPHILSGLCGLIIFFLSLLLFIGSTELLLYREKWFLIKEPLELIFSLNIIFRYIYIIMAFFAISGGSILFFFFYWNGGKKDRDGDYSALVTKISINYTFIFIILHLFFGFLFLMTLPAKAISEDVVGPSALILLLSYGLCIALYRYDLKFEVPVMIGLIILFLCMALNDYISREVSIEEHTKKLISMANEYREKITGEHIVEELFDGRVIYKNVCSSCHLYDREFKGPSFSAVLPKYENKIEELKAYIRNPVKVDPAYPPMQNPGLREEEIKAVAEYLLTDYLKENKK